MRGGLLRGVKLCYNNSQQENTNSKGDFVLKPGVKVCFKNSSLQK